MQIKNILLPIDGSIYSDHATDYAVYLAKLSGARIHAVCCHEWRKYRQDVVELLVKELQVNVAKRAEKILERMAQSIKEAGVECTCRTVSGEPGKVLTDLAKSKKFDLIVMGSHGHSEIIGLCLGSVTLKMIRTIYCPVMIVP